MTRGDKFWEDQPLSEMTRQEWESLCDGCGRCCLHKLEDVDTREIGYTNVACYLLDLNTCQCKDYDNRNALVPTCVHLTEKNIHEFTWLPDTCAYRLLAEGKELKWWHPLISGDPMTVHQAGISVRNLAIREEDVDMKNLEEHVVAWMIVNRED